MFIFLIEEKAINGSNFKRVSLPSKTNAFQRLEESERTLESSIVNWTGVSLKGNDIYVRSAQPESKEKGTFIYVFIFKRNHYH